jgi:CRISPR-associated endonuclease/helicase Cas3
MGKGSAGGGAARPKVNSEIFNLHRSSWSEITKRMCSPEHFSKSPNVTAEIPNFIAHVRRSGEAIQSLDVHLRETADLASLFSSAIGLPECGRLLGLTHDFGKYSAQYQNYIRAITGLAGETAKSAAEKQVGTIDHATAGAQLVWGAVVNKRIPRSLGQILAVVIMSHHSRSGMKDFLALNGRSPFLERLERPEGKTSKLESLRNADPDLLAEIDGLLGSPAIVSEFKAAITRINGFTRYKVPRENTFALVTRYLFSCLLDADRLSTSDFENPEAGNFRNTGRPPDWPSLLASLETHLSRFGLKSDIDKLRTQISDECRVAASRPETLFTLQVPTGGGKTLASLRFALHRAASQTTHRVDRIIYVLPYTSILDQNAEVAREILGKDAVLEHHSNLSEEKDTWRNRVLSENWDAPVVFTTSVQFLDALFAGGTKTARRMHQLSNAILIFDEIQSLPVKTIHLFNNAINFLCQQGNTTAVLCTATMPLLQTVNAACGAIPISPESSIIRDKVELFRKLKRTTIVNDCRPGGWSNAEIANHALELQQQHGSLLIVCNTKNSARHVFDLLKAKSNAPVVHLSTSMCPAHRRHKIAAIRSKLDPRNLQPVICISTQLIEAGVDLDFGCVIRSLAGLDSIVQAAGRCNRHGHREMGFVHILNFKEERLHVALKEIELAQQITQNRILHEYQSEPGGFDHDLLSEKAMNRFYEYYFSKRANEMRYPCSAKAYEKRFRSQNRIKEDSSVLSLLSTNEESENVAKRIRKTDALGLPFKHAFSAAAQAFQVIDAPTQGILVPYDHDGHIGSTVIGDLAACYTNEDISLAEQVRRHKKAQQYTVNAFPYIVERLAKERAIHEVHGGSGVFHLDERFYDDDLGVTLEALSEQHYLGVH